MNNIVSLIFPHQIYKILPNDFYNNKMILIEESLFFNQYKFHIQKLTYHRLTLQNYMSYLKEKDLLLITFIQIIKIVI